MERVKECAGGQTANWFGLGLEIPGLGVSALRPRLPSGGEASSSIQSSVGSRPLHPGSWVQAAWPLVAP